MAPSDLQAYLASKYLSGAKADAISARAEAADGKRKKKKRKLATQDTGGGGLVKDDDAVTGWGAIEVEDEEKHPPWKPALQPSKSVPKTPVPPGLSSAPPPHPQPPKTHHLSPQDEQPQVVGMEEDPEPEGFKGGLQTSAQIRAQAELLALRAASAKHAAASTTEEEKEEATVHRDSSGRVIDTKAARAEQKRREAKEMEAQMKKMEWGKGVVQREDKEKRKKELESMQGKAFARHADDEDMNAEMKDVQRWNDPAAQFLTTKKVGKKGPTRPKYAGPAPPPNRYGIPPGYRWDGVDRSNGFESKISQKANERKRNTAAAYSWSVDEM